MQRLIQPEALVEGVTDGFSGALAECREAGIAGQQPGDDEDDEDDAEQRGDAEQQSSDDVLGHPIPSGGSGPGVR